MDIETREIDLISNGQGVTTCGFFQYPNAEKIIYSSTFLDNSACPPKPDYSRGYVWKLYPGYDIYSAELNGSNPISLTSSPGYDAEATYSFDGKKIIYTSLINNKGINEILGSILKKTKKWELINQNFVITNQRHFESMTKTLNSVESIFLGIDSNISGELLSIDIKEALNHLGEITGEITNEQLLDSIFRDFCIGK